MSIKEMDHHQRTITFKTGLIAGGLKGPNRGWQQKSVNMEL